MDLVLTVIGNSTSRGLAEEAASAAGAALEAAGAQRGAVDWLASGLAADIPFAGIDPGTAEAAARERLAGAPLDLAAQAAEGRRKALLLADMESTIIAQEMIDELAERLGLRDQVAAITARCMAGELNFEEALVTRVQLLAGLPVSAFDEVAERITLNPGARTLIRTLAAQGVHTALVSGGFTVFAERVREACGFHEARANRLLVDDNRLTGEVGRPILGPSAKLEALKELAKARDLPLSSACTVGDGANDAEMLAAAGLGVGYRPKPPARKAARVALDHSDLTAPLYLQGYRSADLVA